jgi:hypothetical protein
MMERDGHGQEINVYAQTPSQSRFRPSLRYVDLSRGSRIFGPRLTESRKRGDARAERSGALVYAKVCGAKTRAGHPCRQAAVRGRPRCRMHGGAKGSGGPLGNRNGNFKHGRFTRESKMVRRVVRAKVREINPGSSGQPTRIRR